MFWRFYFSHIKRQFQYSCLCAKNNHSIFRLLASRSRARFTSTHLLPHLLLLSTYFLRASCHACSLLVSASRILAWVLLSCLVSLACMYTLHSCSASRPHYRTCFPTVLVHFSSRASCLHALTSYHTLHYCSVPVQHTSRQS